jgi:carbamoyl-phosphate synthase large subunit
VLSGVEPVLEALAPHAAGLRERTGAVAVVSPPEVLEIGQDKLATADWLRGHGFRSPLSADAADTEAVARLVADRGLPLVAKPRRGKGAQGVVTLRTRAELELVAGQPEIAIQEHLGDDEHEYTIGVVCDREGQPQGTLAMRRDLESGTTYRAEAGEFAQVSAYAREIASALRPLGPLNVQLRLVDGQPVAFELNVRFSGTTPMRARLGFNEVEATVRHFVLDQPIRLPVVNRGTVLRYWNELYVPDDGREELTASGRLDDPWSHGPVVEDWGMRR